MTKCEFCGAPVAERQEQSKARRMKIIFSTLSLLSIIPFVLALFFGNTNQIIVCFLFPSIPLTAWVAYLSIPDTSRLIRGYSKHRAERRVTSLLLES